MREISEKRIASIDLLKGLVMVIMALDHVRDYFHIGAFIFDPGDPERTTLAIFFTRWITHFCAPTFSLLAGISAYLAGRKKTKGELSVFLFTRGLWLMFLELTVINFAWYFDVQFRTPTVAVIWALGVSMVVLALLVRLPRTVILVVSLVMIAGHNLLDGVHYEGNIPWGLLHDGGLFKLGDGYQLVVVYPVVPWIAVMSLGYCLGVMYEPTYDPAKRRRLFNILGVSALVLFVALISINSYGDPHPWRHLDTTTKTAISLLNPTKYPPSLIYLMMTLGPALLFLANSERWRGHIVDFFSTFGKVPFFYYIIHIYVIHLAAMVFAALTRFGWRSMILEDWLSQVPALKGYGFGLWVTYVVWIALILLLYPLCRWFAAYKMRHREWVWLSYL